jgi:SAM-dependent methyltransferase
MPANFADHFSGHATDYAKYRPGYPPELFAWLLSLTPEHQLAWDVGTGNGQAAVQLAQRFSSVVATDPSTEQIKNASEHSRVSYRVSPAEESDLLDTSVDLVTIAQAIHWFDFDRFYTQVRRVLKPNGAVVAWTYTLNHVSTAVDAVVRYFYQDVVGSYWPGERKYIEGRYENIPFPFFNIVAPPINMVTQCSYADYLSYLRTWSATQRYIKAKQLDPIELIRQPLLEAWGSPDQVLTIHWPIHVRAGRVNNPAA